MIKLGFVLVIHGSEDVSMCVWSHMVSHVTQYALVMGNILIVSYLLLLLLFLLFLVVLLVVLLPFYSS